MTVESLIRSIEHNGDGVEKTFTYPFRIFDEDHLVVTLVHDDTTETVKTITTHYLVTGVEVFTGGTVVFGTAPLGTDVVRIERVVPHLQLADFRNQGKYTPQTLEDALDKIVMMIQSAGTTLLVTINDIIEQGGIPEFTRATLPNVTGVPTVGAFWDNKLCWLIEDTGQRKLLRCIERATADTYDWQVENTGGFL